MKQRAIGVFLFLTGMLWIISGCGSDSTTVSVQSGESKATFTSSINSQDTGAVPEKGLKKRIKAAYVPGEVLIKFKSHAGVGATDIERKSSEAGVKTKLKRSISHLNIHNLKITEPDLTVEDAIKKFKSHPDVEFAEPNYIVRAFATPTDPSFSSLWGLDNIGQTGGTVDADIDAPEAWDITTGSNSVVIAVVDTGVAYNHPDLSANKWINTDEIANGLDDDSNGYIDDIYGWDFIDDDGYPEDYNTHGTHVAGTIAAVGNNSVGITGVMWQAKIMPLRFLGVSGAGDTASAVAAITYAVDNGAKIINASWGGGASSQSLYDAIDYARQNNVLFVTAAGNDGLSNEIFSSYPANYSLDNIISVAATDANDTLASFSNFGATSVDLGAPGVSIYSYIPTFTYGGAVTVYSKNFDTDSAGSLPSDWSSGGTNNTWAVTNTTANSSPNSFTDSPSGTYLPNTNSWAGYMIPITSEKNNRYTLSFQWKGYIDQASNDYLNINYSTDGITWDWIDWTDGNKTVWTTFTTEELTAVADVLDTFYFGFGLESDAFGGNYDGAYIDDVSLVRQLVSISGYTNDSYDGTSMSTPHVSGAAGLVLSANSALTYQQVREVILNNVDQKSSLSGATYTGGRLNAYNALYAAVNYVSLPTAPSGLTAATASSSQINLSWTDASNETGIKIERKNSAIGAYTEIATASADTTAYSDTGLSASTTYYYRIRAYNSYGNSSYSDEVSATTSSSQTPPPSDGGGGGGGDGGGGGGGGCFIATAAYGSYLAPEVKILRQFRDSYLITNSTGRSFVEFYYKTSPPIAEYISQHKALRLLTRLALTPLVYGIKYPFASLIFIGLVIIGVRYKITHPRLPLN